MAKRFGRYEVLEHLSKGGMAEVYKGRSSGAAGFEKVVAIKRILPSLSGDPMFVSMFVEEAKLSANLNHVNIAQIYEFGEVDGQYFIAMEYVHGKDLRVLQRHFRQSGSSMPIPMVLRIVLDVCSALDYAHNRRDATGSLLQIVHRDISPPNVLISYEGAVKLIDFGIAKALTRSSSTATGILKGKLGYLSPEQAEGHALDGRSDIFALGTVLWELLTGVRLFHEATDMATLMKVRRAEVAPPSDLNPEVPAGLDAIVLNALSREADDRFQRADLFYEALERVARQPGLGFSAIQLGRFMAGTFAPALEEATAVATPSPSRLRVEVLAPEPLDQPSARPDTPARSREQRTPTPVRKSEPRTPAPAVTRPSQPIQPQSTGPALQPESISAGSVPGEDLDPSTRVSGESAKLARTLGTPHASAHRLREDHLSPTRTPSPRPTLGGAARASWTAEEPSAEAPAPPPPRPAQAPAPPPPRAAQAPPPTEEEEDWEDGPTNLKEEPAVIAIVAALEAGDVIPLDEREPPAKPGEPDTSEVLLPDSRRPATGERQPVDLSQMIEASIIDDAEPARSAAPPAGWPEPMEEPERASAPPHPAPPNLASPISAPTPSSVAKSPAPTSSAPEPQLFWDDGPTRFEPVGSPAMAEELGSEHALGEADRMVLAPPPAEIEEDLPAPGVPRPRRPVWPWVVLVLAALGLTAAVVLLVRRLAT